MKRQIDQEQLLNDVLADEPQTGLNAAALDRLLNRARRRRRARQIRRVGSALAIVAVAMSGFLFRLGLQKPEAKLVHKLVHKPVVSPGYKTVTSFALLPEQQVSSLPLSPEQIILSGGAVTVVKTSGENFESVNDEELLELAKPNIAVLVRRGQHGAELVLVEPPTAN